MKTFHPKSWYRHLDGFGSITVASHIRPLDDVPAIRYHHHRRRFSELKKVYYSKNLKNKKMIQEGDNVIVIKSGLRGVVRYVGETEFKSGLWIGLELELRRGKNDGSVRDVRYFECRPTRTVS